MPYRPILPHPPPPPRPPPPFVFSPPSARRPPDLCLSPPRAHADRPRAQAPQAPVTGPTHAPSSAGMNIRVTTRAADRPDRLRGPGRRRRDAATDPAGLAAGGQRQVGEKRAQLTHGPGGVRLGDPLVQLRQLEAALAEGVVQPPHHDLALGVARPQV